MLAWSEGLTLATEVYLEDWEDNDITADSANGNPMSDGTTNTARAELNGEYTGTLIEWIWELAPTTSISAKDIAL